MASDSGYAVIFSSQRHAGDEGYSAMAKRMEELAATQPGFISIENARGSDGFGITISYWRSLEDIQNWKQNLEHLVAQKLGREKWYEFFKIRVCEIKRELEFNS